MLKNEEGRRTGGGEGIQREREKTQVDSHRGMKNREGGRRKEGGAGKKERDRERNENIDTHTHTLGVNDVLLSLSPLL